jgi:GT2 family glycosyltransferase
MSSATTVPINLYEPLATPLDRVIEGGRSRRCSALAPRKEVSRPWGRRNSQGQQLARLGFTAPMEPTFSVIVPALDAEMTIGGAIRSVLAQTRTDFELLVVDDGSTDNTVEEVRKEFTDPRARLLTQEHGGAAAARNCAISEARGTFISMLDSDDLWLPSYLQVMGDVLAGDPKAALAYTDAWLFDEVKGRFQRATATASALPPSAPPAEPLALLARLLQNNFIYTSVTVRRDVILRVGPFNTDLPAASDYEMWLRIAARGYTFVRAPGRLAIHRQRPGSLSSNPRRLTAGVRDAYLTVAQDPTLPEELRTAARTRIRECQALLASSMSADPRQRLLGLRPHLSRLKHAVLRTWYRNPPPEVRWAVAELTQH